MSQRLSHLKDLLAGKGPTQQTDKTDERAFVSSVSDRGRHIFNDTAIFREPDQRTPDNVPPGSHELITNPLAEMCLPQSLTKLTKGASVSSVSEEREDISRDEGNSEDTIAAFEERAAISEYDGGLERGQAESLAALQAMPLPKGVNEYQRTVVIDAAARFLDHRRRRR
jgi:hypothetical protein